MKNIINDYQSYFKSKSSVKSFFFSVLILVTGIFTNYLASIYSTVHASSSVNDIILDNIPTFDVDLLFIWGSYFMVFCIFLTLISNPKRIVFALNTIGFFAFIRAFFVVLTHIGQPLHQLPVETIKIGSSFLFNGDLFFSGHAGLPFLIALIFWGVKRYRIFYIMMSFTFALIVLMGHYHYSIDVFASYFITFGIYKTAEEIAYRVGLSKLKVQLD